MSLTKLPWPGIIKLFPARESLVSDIPAGNGKNDNLFFTVYARDKVHSAGRVNVTYKDNVKTHIMNIEYLTTAFSCR